jgi:hypothetical protein
MQHYRLENCDQGTAITETSDTSWIILHAQHNYRQSHKTPYVLA